MTLKPHSFIHSSIVSKEGILRNYAFNQKQFETAKQKFIILSNLHKILGQQQIINLLEA